MLPSKTKVMVMAALLGLGGGSVVATEPQIVDTWFWTIGKGADPAAGARASCHIYGMAPVRIEKAELRAGPYQRYLVRCGSIAL